MNLKYYSSMSPDKCIHLCNSPLYQDIDPFVSPKSSLCPFSVHPPPQDIHCSDLFHHRLVLPILELLINDITHYVPFCVGIFYSTYF